MKWPVLVCSVVLIFILQVGVFAKPRQQWEIGEPITTAWAMPHLTEASAQRLAAGNWNLVWCSEETLGVAEKYGLRAQLKDPLLTPESLRDEAQRKKLDALIKRVKDHPALYSYYITDEPGADEFEAISKLVAYLREKDPKHLAYINLYPIYASEDQLEIEGEPQPRYRQYLHRFINTVDPDLLSYDHYHFRTNGEDGQQYFLNLAMIREAALEAGIPFLNIVQASSWSKRMRVPTCGELRWLAYTSLAYGAGGLSYYVYRHPTHDGGMVADDGDTTYLYNAARKFNSDFLAIARQLQPLRSLGAYHAGMLPPGAEPVPGHARLRLHPRVPRTEYQPPDPVEGLLLGYFAQKPLHPDGNFLDKLEWLFPNWPRPETLLGCDKPWATHVLVVNLDYENPVTKTLVASGPLEVFRPQTGKWFRVSADRRTELELVPGGGKLLRLRRWNYPIMADYMLHQRTRR